MTIQSPQLPAHPPPAPLAGARRPLSVARQFESMFVSIMLKSMRSSVMENELIPRSTGEKIYTDMLDKEYASLLARNASFGLTDLILRELDGEKGTQGADALAMLRGLENRQWAFETGAAPSTETSFNAMALARRAGRWSEIIADAAQRYAIDRDLLTAVVAQESAGDPAAVSHAGAKGLMQLIDSTASDMGVADVFDPRQNVMGGARYLRRLLDMHGGDERLALASYNAGPGAVRRYNGIPPYRETQDYVQRVLRIRSALAGASTDSEE
jgi:soluble lytic murein transglycosylase-like protein